jgi:hypothetical protein
MSGPVGIILALLYLSAIFAVGIYLLVLLTRFVKAHQRSADALEAIARKLPPLKSE